MHWQWKNCPVTWQGQFQDKDKNRYVILEAIADQSLWIWHFFLDFLVETMISMSWIDPPLSEICLVDKVNI